jgi:hypothetical protein
MGTKCYKDDRQNASVVRKINNQVFALGFAHEWRHVRATREGTFTRSEVNSYSCKRSAKKAYNWG